MTNEIVVPESLRDRVEALGTLGVRWLEHLPALAAECADGWGVELGYAIERPSGALVIRSRRGERPVVVKLWPPVTDGFEREEAILRAARGRGYVQLLESDAERHALLLEALGNELDVEEYEPAHGWDGVRAVYVETLKQAWALPLSAVPTVDERTHAAAQLRDLLLQTAPPDDVPDSHRAVERALAYADHRLADNDPGRHVVVHGNMHPRNLRHVVTPRFGAESGFVLVEPVGFRCEREFDLANILLDAPRAILRADDSVLLVREWCAQLAGDTGTDAEVIWEWAFLQRVARGVSLMAAGEPHQGRVHLQVASALINRRR